MPRRRSSADWQSLIAEFESGSQSAAAFCSERDLNAGYFSKVRARLRKQPSDFVPIRVSAASRSVTIQVQDVTIRCDAGTSSTWLRELIRALRT